MKYSVRRKKTRLNTNISSVFVTICAILLMCPLYLNAAETTKAENRVRLGVYPHLLKAQSDSSSGFLVGLVNPQSPADKLGITNQDRILMVNGKNVSTSGDIAKHLENAKLGDEISVEFSHRNLFGEVKVMSGKCLAEKYPDIDPISLPTERIIAEMFPMFKGVILAKVLRNSIELAIKNNDTAVIDAMQHRLDLVKEEIARRRGIINELDNILDINNKNLDQRERYREAVRLASEKLQGNKYKEIFDKFEKEMTVDIENERISQPATATVESKNLIQSAKLKGHAIGLEMANNEKKAQKLLSDAADAERLHDNALLRDIQSKIQGMVREKNERESAAMEYVKGLTQAERDAYIEGIQSAKAGK